MKILTIDTSSTSCGVSILEDTKLLKDFSQNNGLVHSESLMPIIQNALQSLNLNLSDIDLIVCDKGPGSFTGIRIGVATAMAFNDSMQIPCVGISSLEVLAYNVSKNKCVICALIDAKNDNVYVGVFEKIDNTMILRREYSVENIYDLLKEFECVNYNITFVGDGAVTYKNLIISNLKDKAIFIGNNELSAYNLGLAGLKHYKTNDVSDILPLYLRKPQAERLLEQKNNC